MSHLEKPQREFLATWLANAEALERDMEVQLELQRADIRYLEDLLAPEEKEEDAGS